MSLRFARWTASRRKKRVSTWRPSRFTHRFSTLRPYIVQAPIYRKHVQAMAESLQVGMAERSGDAKPWHFLKVPRTIVGTGATVPANSPELDWEAELVAVIGRECAGVDSASALQYVAGYTIANDLSARDRMRRSDQPDGSPFLWDWLGHKSFDGACPLGPWIVPAFAISDPQRLSIRLWVDDRLRQNGNSKDMIFSVAEQIAHLSQRMTLFPGDLVLTGTPSGVGAESKEYLSPGNRVRIAIDSIGELNVKIGGPVKGSAFVDPAA